MRPLVLRVLAVSIGVAAGLASIELLLRALEGAHERGDLRALHMARPDRPWLYGLRPGAEARLREPADVRYLVNEAGFRDRNHPLQKPEGVFRIVALGDSVTFGYGVEEGESYPKQLEAVFARRSTSPRVEVLNFGVGGYNAYNEATQFADLGPRYEPDLVMVQFCINDLNDPTLHFDRQTRLELGRLPDAAFPNPAQRLPLAEPPGPVLRLCLRLRSCARIHGQLAGLDALRESPAVLEGTFAPRDGPEHVTEWRWLRARYREIAQTASEAGAGFVVLAFPFEAQLADAERRSAQHQLEEMGREEGWQTIDLLPAFREAARSQRLLADAWHPTTTGHRLAAEVVARALRCRGLVPGEPTGCDEGGASIH
ncbi:MAG: SGNH/GDSL hydrolase family protein [Myxococcota bacterium]